MVVWLRMRMCCCRCLCGTSLGHGVAAGRGAVRRIGLGAAWCCWPQCFHFGLWFEGEKGPKMSLCSLHGGVEAGGVCMGIALQRCWRCMGCSVGCLQIPMGRATLSSAPVLPGLISITVPAEHRMGFVEFLGCCGANSQQCAARLPQPQMRMKIPIFLLFLFASCLQLCMEVAYYYNKSPKPLLKRTSYPHRSQWITEIARTEDLKKETISCADKAAAEQRCHCLVLCLSHLLSAREEERERMNKECPAVCLVLLGKG